MMNPNKEAPYEPAALAALRRLLSQSPRRFSLNLAVCTLSESRLRLIEELRGEFETIASVELIEDTQDVFGSVMESAPPGPRDAVFVTNLDRVVGEGRDTEVVVQALDASPRRWTAWYPYPVIFWIGQPGSDALMAKARDFWEWQSNIFRLDPAP